MKKYIGLIIASIAVVGAALAAMGAWFWPYIVCVWTGRVISWQTGAILGLCPVIGELTIPAAIVSFVFQLTTL